MLDALLTRLGHYARLTRLDKPVGIALLLWPTLWALWLAADGVPHALNLLVFAAGVVLMRSAGCAINDYADRDFDPHVERTRDRPLAAGLIRPREALAVFAALSLAAFLLVLLLDPVVLKLSVVGLLLAASYPFMKRWHHLPQVHLGIAFSWAIPMAYAAESGGINLAALLLFLANVLWTVAYDTMYAMADREDDIRIGVKSTAILFGRHDRLIIGLLQIATIDLLLIVGVIEGLGWAFDLGLAVAAGLALWQQWLIRQREPAACIAAFKNNPWFGLAVLVGIVADLALR
ncbi:MAG: 4-hydroxybenzoate octaprenyltransferase [Halothiobacillaceae bacterium]|nr:MAG: 4-hydroxybenzoate octaprenyltransferase [Halothiobacillaceae bacterium]